MKVIFNYATRQFESMEPNMNDRFDLKRLKAAVPLLAPALLPAAAAFLGLSGTGLVLQQKIQNYFENNPEALPKFKEYLKTTGVVLPFGTLPGDRPEEEAEEKEFGKLKGFDKAPERLKEKGTTIPEKIKTDQPLKTPPKTELLPGLSKPEDVDTSILYRTEEEKAKAREYARKKREREKAGDTEKFRPDPEKEAVINTAIKEYKDVAPPIKPGDNRAYKPGNTGFETIKIATEEFRKQYGRNPSNTEIQKYTGNDRGTIRRAFQNHGDILGELMSMDDYRLISPKTVDTKLTEEYQEEARNKLINEAIELDTVRTYKDEVFFKNDERRDLFIDNFIKRANFGINRKGVPGYTYDQLAKEFNMSRSQVTKAIQVLQKDPLISSQLDRPEGRDASYYGTVNKQVLAEGRKQLAPWERSNVDIQDNKVTEINKILSELTLDEVKEQYPQIITDFKWKLVKTGDDKGKIIEVDRPDEKLEKDIKKAFSIEHGKNKSTREVDIQRLTNRYLTTKKNNDLLVSIKAYIKREGESTPEINDWLTERGIRIIVDKKGYGAPKAEAFNSKTGEHVNFNEALEFYGFDGDVVGPTKERYEVLQLKEDINKQLGEGTITTADEAPEPDSSILRRLFKDFKERTGFKDGSPKPIESEATIDQALAALNSSEVRKQFLYDTSPIGKLNKSIFGKDDDRSLMQQFNTQFLDPRSYPYYAQKTLRGAANIPELAFRFPFAVTGLARDLITGEEGKLERFGETLDPKLTRKIAEGGIGELLGISSAQIEAAEEKRTNPQKVTGEFLQFGAEVFGPATPYFLIKKFPKLFKQLRDLGASGTAVDKINKEIENKVAQQGVDQTRRDIVLSIGAGGAVAFLKYLGLDFLTKAPKAAKVTEEIVTKGGTPKYFFDFVSLIKSKGKDITDKASTLERQKVYDYNGYELTEDISTGKITIRKDTEGGASYSIGDGEFETVEGIVKKEEINYEPPETILDDAGKPKEVPDQYDEATLKPDAEGDLADIDQGLDSIDEILDLLAKDGKKYTYKELSDMGLNLEGLGKDKLQKILKDPEFVDKIFKAGGGRVDFDKGGPTGLAALASLKSDKDFDLKSDPVGIVMEGEPKSSKFDNVFLDVIEEFKEKANQPILYTDGTTYYPEYNIFVDREFNEVPGPSKGAIPVDERDQEVIPQKRLEAAGGGILKMAGDDSGPPPKSGPTPHGLPYVAKNVRPIKERK